ncbi:MAG: Calx-beta domain-containing protein [Chloroflexota bacterium]
MIKRITRARIWRQSPFVLLGAAVLIAYLSAASHPPSVRAIPAQQTKPTVGFVNTVYTVAENQGPAVISVSVTLTPASGEDVVVTYITVPGTATEGAGGDYVSTSGQLTFTNSTQNTQTFEVTINNDNILNEPNETVNLILQLQTPNTANIGTSQATLVITDDDLATATPRPTAATGTPIFVDLTEPNNTFQEAYQIQPDAAATCQLTLWPPGDLDYYAFAVKNGTFYKILTDQLSPGIDTVLKIYNQNGEPIAENDDFGGVPGNLSSQVVVRAGTTGIYFARVVNKSPADAANKTYCLMVDAMDEPTPTPTPTLLPTRTGSDACEPNGQLAIACLFGENQSQAFNFVPPFREGPDQDFYRIWVKPGTTITCETTELSSVTDTNMIFLGPNGEDFNPQLGNDDKEPGNKGSRLTYTSTYTGWLHVLVGPVNPVPLAQAAQFTYTLACTSTVPPTATPTLPPTTGGGGGVIPIAPTITPFPTVTPFDLSAILTPSPVVIPEVTIQPLPTATPPVGSLGVSTVNVTVFYDSNFNFTPEDNEGIIDVAVALFDNTNGRLIAFGYTNQAGSVRFEAVPSSGAVRVEVPLLSFSQIVGPGESNIAVRVAPLPLPIGIP